MSQSYCFTWTSGRETREGKLRDGPGDLPRSSSQRPTLIYGPLNSHWHLMRTRPRARALVSAEVPANRELMDDIFSKVAFQSGWARVSETWATGGKG